MTSGTDLFTPEGPQVSGAESNARDGYILDRGCPFAAVFLKRKVYVRG